MSKRFLFLSCLLWGAVVLAAPLAYGQSTRKAVPAAPVATDPLTLERQLQRLNWDQFRSVVESVPRLKAGVDQYGPLGWQYVRMNYQTYRWQQQLVKLDEAQRTKLAQLIARVKTGRAGV